jgi:multidrug efflux pump subunit AcrA (membrane-fusion protein)
MWIDPGADYSKATVQVKVRIENPDDRLRVEGSAQVTFFPEVEAAVAAARTGPSLWIPATACLPDPSGQTATVFVAVNGRLRRSTVSIGRKVGGQIEVTRGLQEGQSIAADGLANLADGQRLPS